jgi:hypothetical protein
MMVTIGTTFTSLTFSKTSGLKLEEMVYGLKAVIGHRRLLWVNACIYLVDMMVLGK